MLVRRCCLTRPDDLVGLGGVEHMQFPRRHKPLEARIRRPLDRRHRPLPPAPATPGSRARTLPAPSNRTDTTALPALGDPGVSRNLVPDLPMAGSVLTLAAPPNGTWLSIRVDLGMRSLTDAVRRGDKWRGFAELNGGFRATSEGICAGHGVVPVGEGIASGLDPARKPRESPPNKSALYSATTGNKRFLLRAAGQRHSPTPGSAPIVDWLAFGGNIIETGTDSYRLAHTKAIQAAS